MAEVVPASSMDGTFGLPHLVGLEQPGRTFDIRIAEVEGEDVPVPYSFADGRIVVLSEEDGPRMLVDGIEVKLPPLWHRLLRALSAPGRLDVSQSNATLLKEAWRQPPTQRVVPADRIKVGNTVSQLRARFGDETLRHPKLGAVRATELGFMACSTLMHKG